VPAAGGQCPAGTPATANARDDGADAPNGAAGAGADANSTSSGAEGGEGPQRELRGALELLAMVAAKKPMVIGERLGLLLKASSSQRPSTPPHPVNPCAADWRPSSRVRHVLQAGKCVRACFAWAHRAQDAPAPSLGASAQVGFSRQRPDAVAARAAAAALRRLGAAAAADPAPPSELRPALQALAGVLLQPCMNPMLSDPDPGHAGAPAAAGAGAGPGAAGPGAPRGDPRSGSGPGQGLPESGWYGAAEEAVAAVYALHPEPAALAAAVLERLAAAALGRLGAGGDAAPSGALAHFFHVLGQARRPGRMRPHSMHTRSFAVLSKRLVLEWRRRHSVRDGGEAAGRARMCARTLHNLNACC